MQEPNGVYVNMTLDLMFCVTVYQFRWMGDVFLFGSQSLEGFVMLIGNHLGSFAALSFAGWAVGHSDF